MFGIYKDSVELVLWPWVKYLTNRHFTGHVISTNGETCCLTALCSCLLSKREQKPPPNFKSHGPALSSNPMVFKELNLRALSHCSDFSIYYTIISKNCGDNNPTVVTPNFHYWIRCRGKNYGDNNPAVFTPIFHYWIMCRGKNCQDNHSQLSTRSLLSIAVNNGELR